MSRKLIKDIDYEEFSDEDDDIDYNKNPIIEELIEFSKEEEKIICDSIKDRSRLEEQVKNLTIEQRQLINRNINSDFKYEQNVFLKEQEEITNKIKEMLIEYDSIQKYKETPISNIFVNIYGNFYFLKNNNKIKISYLHSKYNYPVIKYKGIIYDARKLLFDTFVCNSNNLELSYKKNLKYNDINILKNIDFKLIKNDLNEQWEQK